MSDDTQAEELFHRRRQILAAGFVIWGVFGLIRLIFSARWPVLHAWWLHFAIALLICILLIWAFRCTLCGGGIKLDGKTCNRCGHIFR